MDDNDLLERYRRHGEQQAFAELVRRHSSWIYPSARRQLGDAHLAEDAAQAVFLLLARKVARLSPRSNLAGWLFGTLRYCIKETRRQRSRQQHREMEAAHVRPEPAPQATWDDIAPLLDEAIARLGKPDREAILLRFYQQRPLAEVGHALGTTEEAARKRVDRAVEKLRARLTAKGVEAEAIGLSAVLLAHAAEGGPAGLVEKVMGGMGSNVAGGIAKRAAKMMAMAKVKVGLAVAALVLAGSGVVIHVAAAPPSVAEGPASPAPAAPAVAPSVRVEVLVRGSVQERHLYESLYLLRHKERGPKTELFDHLDQLDQWCDAIRQVIEIGKPAVPYLIAELDSTKSDFCMRNVAFTLRAIGDPRAVPALLRAMPRCVFVSSDGGLPLTNPQLAQFMVKHSVEGTAPQVPDAAKRAVPTSLFFYYHRPIAEIDAALKKLTGHSEGDAHLRANPRGKTDTEQQTVRDVYSATATRWQKWWDQNHAKLISDQELATVQLPPAQGDPIEAAGKAKFGDLTGADLPLEPLGIDRLQTRFSRVSRAVNQKDAKAVSDAVAGALEDYKAVAQQAAEQQAKGNPLPAAGAVMIVADHPESRVALLEDLQKAVQAGDWSKARTSDAKLSELGPGLFSFTVAAPPTTIPVAGPVRAGK